MFRISESSRAITVTGLMALQNNPVSPNISPTCNVCFSIMAPELSDFSRMTEPATMTLTPNSFSCSFTTVSFTAYSLMPDVAANDTPQKLDHRYRIGTTTSTAELDQDTEFSPPHMLKRSFEYLPDDGYIISRFPFLTGCLQLDEQRVTYAYIALS